MPCSIDTIQAPALQLMHKRNTTGDVARGRKRPEPNTLEWLKFVPVDHKP